MAEDTPPPPLGILPAFDWKWFWWTFDQGLMNHVKDRAFDTPYDAENLARLGNRVYRNRVRFSKCTFKHPVDFAYARFEQSLELVGCTFEAGLVLRHVQVATRLTLRGSTVHDDAQFWLDWRGLKTGADLSLIEVTAHAPIDLYNAVIGADLRLDGLHVLAKGRSKEEVKSNQALGDIDRHRVASTMVDSSLHLEGAEIRRDVYARTFGDRRMTAKGTIDLRARIGGGVFIDNALIGSEPDSVALNLESAKVGWSLFICNGTQLSGKADLRAAFGGDVHFDGSEIHTNTNEIAVDMEAAEVGGSVWFVNQMHITGRVNLRTRVFGQVTFEHAIVMASTVAKAVVMNRARIDGSVFFRDRTRITGQVDLRAIVGGQIDFDHATITALTGASAVLIDAAEVGGSVFFAGGTRIKGRVDLRAKVMGTVEFENTVIDAGKSEVAVDFTAAEIGGTCFMRNRTLIIGELSLIKARSGGGLIFSETFSAKTFGRPGTDDDDTPRKHLIITGGIDLRFADVDGPVLIHGAAVLGEIKARHLSVHGDLHVCGGVVGTIDAASSIALDTVIDDYRRLHTDHIKSLTLFSAADTPTDQWREAVRASEAALEDHLNTILPQKPENGENEPHVTGWRPWDTACSPARDDQTALDLELADIHGQLWIKGARALGTIRAEDAEIDGEANFDRTVVEGDLVLRSATIKGRVFADEMVSDAPYPQVRGSVDARGATLTQVSISIARPNEKGKCSVCPEAILLDRAIVQELEVRGTMFRDRENPLFRVHRLKFEDLELDRLNGKGSLPLSTRDALRFLLWFALMGLCALVIHRSGQPRGSDLVLSAMVMYGMMTIHLWRLNSPHPGILRLRDFLDATRFSSAFYVDVERWARSEGNDPQADEVFLSRRRRELLEARRGHGIQRDGALLSDRPVFTRAERVWRWAMLDFMFGYGVRPGRAIHFFLLLWLLNWAVFLPAYSVERPLSYEVSKTAPASAPSSLAAAPTALPHWEGDGGVPAPNDHWGAQRAFFIAMRLQIPLVDLFIDQPWKPADRAMFADGLKTGRCPLTYENYAAAMRAINLILVPVVIAGAAGFLKRRDTGDNGT